MGVRQKIPATSLNTDYMQQKDISKKRIAKKRKLLIRRLTVFLVFALASSYLFISSYLSRSDLLEAKQAEKVILEQELNQLQKEQMLLENEIVKLNDVEYIAKLARSEYFLSNEGEVIFNIPKSDKKETKN